MERLFANPPVARLPGICVYSACRARVQSPALRAFARFMVDDNVQAESQLAAVANATTV